jgi:hypothetical protein
VPTPFAILNAKTSTFTRRTLGVLWGCTGFERGLADAERWYRALLEQADAVTATVELRSA